eukprot:m.122020 g.122020  ORF g.122020 m.122020 type:complete len:86 (-) comp9386_c0_seq2:11-268(-)
MAINTIFWYRRWNFLRKINSERSIERQNKLFEIECLILCGCACVIVIVYACALCKGLQLYSLDQVRTIKYSCFLHIILKRKALQG